MPPDDDKELVGENGRFIGIVGFAVFVFTTTFLASLSESDMPETFAPLGNCFLALLFPPLLLLPLPSRFIISSLVEGGKRRRQEAAASMREVRWTRERLRACFQAGMGSGAFLFLSRKRCARFGYATSVRHGSSLFDDKTSLTLTLTYKTREFYDYRLTHKE
jgi:hypothetical protein